MLYKRNRSKIAIHLPFFLQCSLGQSCCNRTVQYARSNVVRAAVAVCGRRTRFVWLVTRGRIPRRQHRLVAVARWTRAGTQSERKILKKTKRRRRKTLTSAQARTERRDVATLWTRAAAADTRRVVAVAVADHFGRNRARPRTLRARNSNAMNYWSNALAASGRPAGFSSIDNKRRCLLLELLIGEKLERYMYNRIKSNNRRHCSRSTKKQFWINCGNYLYMI